MKPVLDQSWVESCIERGREVLKREADALQELEGRLDRSFAEAVDLLYRTIVRPEDRSRTGLGKVVVTGIGKSGIIGRKLAATFNSTGATAFFLHPVEAVHGDLGMVTGEDVVVVLSRSGNNEEVNRLIPSLKVLGLPIIAITANGESELARAAAVTIEIGDGPEACSLNLAPTSSAVAMLAVGDALALTLFDLRGLKEEDFARFHPAGALGKRLLLKVEDLMHTGEEMPAVGEEVSMKDVLVEIIEKRLGATTVIDDDGHLSGIITDGDLKRLLLRHQDLFTLQARDVMSTRPSSIRKDLLAADALKLMHADPKAIITCLAVTDEEGSLLGFVHMYDCLRSGVAG